jgi:hypothetical protein
MYLDYLPPFEEAEGGYARRLNPAEFTELNSETDYIYDGFRVIQERDSSGNPLVSYTRGTDLSGDSNLIQEAPAHERRQLTISEQRFARVLGFSPGALVADKSSALSNRSRGSLGGLGPNVCFPELPEKVAAQVRSELQKGCQDLQKVQWKLGHLVQRDGKTPWTTAFLLSKGNLLVLNLDPRPQLFRSWLRNSQIVPFVMNRSPRKFQVFLGNGSLLSADKSRLACFYRGKPLDKVPNAPGSAILRWPDWSSTLDVSDCYRWMRYADRGD